MDWRNRITATDQYESLQIRLLKPKGLKTYFPSAGRERVWQLKSQKGRSIRIMSMYLLQHPLEPRLLAPGIAKRTIWRQRFGARARIPAPPWMGRTRFLVLSDVDARAGVLC
jgi:hypothetical protein